MAEVETKGIDNEEVQRIDDAVKSIRADLASGNAQSALLTGLKAFPSNGTSDAAKEAAANAMLAVFTVIERSTLDSLIKELDDDAKATLLKYIFKTMSLKTEKKVYDLCLAYHAKLTEVGGEGLIMKVFSDKRV